MLLLYGFSKSLLNCSIQPAPYYPYGLMMFLELLMRVVVSRYRDLCSKTSADAREVALESQCVEVTRSPFWDQVAGRELYLGKSTWVGRGEESWKMKAGVGCTPVLSADLRLHHPGRRAPVVWSFVLAPLHAAGRPPLPLAQQKFQTFPPAGRGRALLS